MNIYPVIVIYNKKCADSYSCKKLMELGYIPTVVDNSTADYGNAGFCLGKGMHYISMHGNAGLPKAYNAAIELIKSIDDGTGLVLWFDDDTEIGEEFFKELESSIAEHPEADIFTPVVYSIDKPGMIISPCLQMGVADGRVIAIKKSELDELFKNNGTIDKSEADSAINSGMCVRLSIYSDYYYDENLFLDCVDHDFMYSMKERGVKTYILRNACLYQRLFFHNKWATKESIKTRNKIYNRDYRHYAKKIGIGLPIYIYDTLYRQLFQFYDRFTTPRFKNIYRQVKRRFVRNNCADNINSDENKYILFKDNYGLIINYVLADIEAVERIYLMRSKRIKNLPYFAVSYIKALQLKRALKEMQYVQGKVLITNDVLQYVDVELLSTMKNNGCTLILLIIDPMSMDHAQITATKEILEAFTFDKVYTVDKLDAEKYGFEYINALYSVPAPVMQNTDIKYDLFCCENVNGRKETLNSICKAGNSNETSLDLLMPGDDTDSFIPYEEIAKRLQSSNCILDITHEGQGGTTLRYYEAVVYNRKLLTNNKNIADMPFYNDKYMKIFDDIGEIDWDWVKEREPIDYRYHGEFSPNFAGFF